MNSWKPFAVRFRSPRMRTTAISSSVGCAKTKGKYGIRMNYDDVCWRNDVSGAEMQRSYFEVEVEGNTELIGPVLTPDETSWGNLDLAGDGRLFVFRTSQRYFLAQIVESEFIVNTAEDLPDLDVDDGMCMAGTQGDGTPICSLRTAIEQANAHEAKTTIRFDIDSETEPLIELETPLPAIVYPVIIEGTTQTDRSLEIRGTTAGFDCDGLVLLGGDSEVDNVKINTLSGYGIVMREKGGNVIEDCLIGSRSQVIPCEFPSEELTRSGGIMVGDSPDNAIRWCRISGNKSAAGVERIVGDAVFFTGEGSTGNQIAACTLACGINGVSFRNGASSNYAYANDIFHNTHSVLIDGPETSGNMIERNDIGYDNSTREPRSNDLKGIWIQGGKDNLIVQNCISSNGPEGGYCPDLGAVVVEAGNNCVGGSGNRVAGNAIGRNDLYEPAPNKGHGIVLKACASGNVIGFDSFEESPDGFEGKNYISYNLGSDIVLSRSAGSGNVISGTYLYRNEGAAIDIGDDGPTPNDTLDADDGPNDRQNSPVIVSFQPGGSQVRGYLESKPERDYRIELFGYFDSVDTMRPTSALKVTTDASGRADFTSEVGLTYGRMAATAIDLETGDTSELSIPNIAVNSVSDRSDQNFDDGVCDT